MRTRLRMLWVVTLMVACGGAATPPATEVTAVRRTTLASDPTATGWTAAPELESALVTQDMVEPRLLKASTPLVRVRAMTDGTQVAFRLEWPDATQDDLPGTGRFSDACAVQLPSGNEPDVPAPQMGEPGRPVEITYWRASWQATIDGRPDSINALYPGASVDHYPFEAPSLPKGSSEQEAMAERYAPARALGNAMAGPRDRPVQDLVAEGPSTLRPADVTRSAGKGVRTTGGWAVVVVRPLPAAAVGGMPAQVAFAVWDGADDEAGARKMRTGWIPLTLEGGR